jgi:NAD(P)H-dependent FMN reductase
MSDILLISGSSSERSRSNALLDHAFSLFTREGIAHAKVSVRLESQIQDLIAKKHTSSPV